MKKIYFAPETKVVRIKVKNSMLAGSLGFSNKGVNGSSGLDREDDEEDSFGW